MTSLFVPATVASTDGVVVALHDLGGDGPLVLFAHATGFHGLAWGPVAAHLRDHRGVAPDLRGHGDTAAPLHRSLEWYGFADDILAVVDALGVDDIVGVGHSKGGASLLLVEQRRPGTFRSLYCYEPIVFPPLDVSTPHENPLAAGALRRRMTFASYDDAIANFSSKPPFSVLAPDALEAYVRGGFAPGSDGQVHLKCRPEVEAEVYRMGARHDGFVNLASVSCAVVVACGAADGMGPASIAPLIAERLPHGRLERHEDLGHFGPLENPTEIATAIRAAFGQDDT